MKKMYEIICIRCVVDAGTPVILCSGVRRADALNTKDRKSCSKFY